jgi:hypothetical protein
MRPYDQDSEVWPWPHRILPAFSHPPPPGIRLLKAEGQRIPGLYRLQELPASSYPERTEQNVIDSDGTVIISHGRLTGGSAYTAETAKKQHKPWLHLDMAKLSVKRAAQTLQAWIAENQIEVLNIAGPRQSSDPRIYDTTRELLHFSLLP